VFGVQYKHFSKEAWEPTKGHLYLQFMPSTLEKPDLTEVFSVDEKKLKTLDEFIGYKGRCI